MGIEKNIREAERWYRTGLDDLETAVLLLKHERYAHSCFNAHQAAEKALKSLFYSQDQDPWGHSLVKLLKDGERSSLKGMRDFSRIKNQAAILDRFYIPTRYPNGLPDIIPSEAYTRKDAEDAVQSAKEFIKRVQKILKL